MEIISSRQNNKVKNMVALCDSARRRRESGLCVVHGVKLCIEAARLGLRLRELWMTSQMWTRQDAEMTGLTEAADEIIGMSDSVCQKISPERAPQGMAAIVTIPPLADLETLAARRRLIALDGVQDPVNVGAVARSAVAFGYGGLLLSSDCADPFAPKTLRASMGAMFGIDIAVSNDLTFALAQLKEHGHTPISMNLEPGAKNIDAIARKLKEDRVTMVIGSEGQGIRPAVREVCDDAAFIPMTDGVESLNAAVAAGIAMWEFSRA